MKGRREEGRQEEKKGRREKKEELSDMSIGKNFTHSLVSLQGDSLSLKNETTQESHYKHHQKPQVYLRSLLLGNRFSEKEFEICPM